MRPQDNPYLRTTMKKKSTLYSHSLTLIIFTVCLCFSSFSEARTWTSAADSTKTFEAEFKSLDGEFVKLVKNNGKLFRVRLKILSSADQEFIKEAHRKHIANQPPVKEGLKVHVLGNNWKYPNAKLASVLQFSANLLTVHFKGKKLTDIDVKKGGWPFAVYGVNGRGHKAVMITPTGSIWNQQIYQFAHELAHTLMRHRNGTKHNLWFEESIAEMASIYVLDRVGEEWKKKSPIPGTEGYAKHFTSYALNYKNKKSSKLPAGMTFAKWFKENRQKLIDGKGDARDLQRTIALHILPMVEKNPKYWGAFYYLDESKTAKVISFVKGMQEWQKNSPREYHPFIKDIKKLFKL